jgi:tRNA(Ser,Leu) C12 N-acetylase TAN1|tara:strand:+ start:906 stop:1214 length:309 start_codon:yes stop_codon:yes gene_type:complete
MDNTQIQKLIVDQFSEDIRLRPMSGFKMDFSANPGFKKIFFAASCDCETSALLSVEISEEKDDNEIQAAIPSLVERLERQEKSFRMMDCATHSKMRTGFHKE